MLSIQVVATRLAVWFAAALSALNAHSLVVSFDDRDRTLSEILEVDGVSVRGVPTFGLGEVLVGTTIDIGLGGGSVGEIGTLDRIVAFGSTVSGSSVGRFQEGLNISVNGGITAVTLQMFISVMENYVPPEFVPISYKLGGTGGSELTRYAVLGEGLHKLTFSADPDSYPSSIHFDLISGESLSTYYNSYFNSIGDPESLTLCWGYSIKSVEYTPAPLPDTGTTAFLLFASLSGLLLFCRKRSV